MWLFSAKNIKSIFEMSVSVRLVPQSLLQKKTKKIIFKDEEATSMIIDSYKNASIHHQFYFFQGMKVFKGFLLENRKPGLFCHPGAILPPLGKLIKSSGFQ